MTRIDRIFTDRIDDRESKTVCAIGLDVGGTKIAGGLVARATGEVLLRRVIPTAPERGGQAVLDDCLALAGGLLADGAAQGYAVQGIGVGVAELVDLDGNVTSAHTIDWRGVPVQAAFARLAPALVESDARAPALAEGMYGAGRPYRIFCYVTVGTGISSCLVQDGRPYAGARGNALVLATMPLSTICTVCGAELHPVLEEFASGPALVARYNRQGGQAVERGEAVLAAAAGDAVAVEIVGSAGDALGSSVAFLVNVLDPEAMIVGGGLGMAGGLYWERFVASTRQHIYAENSRGLPILHASLGVDAGLVGAAAAIFQRIETI
ncbi:MAG: ROK family protein [Chloroflexi bacterium]|nr:ROK family protein [Chloroflexota bacterium]